jgi:uncharacterized protein (DUF58 family)
MQPRNSALNYYYFALLLMGVVLGALTRRLEPVCVVLPLAVALCYSRLRRTPPVLTVACQVTPLRAFEGDRIQVEMTLHAETAIPLLELWHVLPPGATCPDGSNRILCTLYSGEERIFRHEVLLARRGTYLLGRLYCRVHPATDLQPLLAEYRHEALCRVYPRVVPLPRQLLPMHTHASFGNYVSRAAGDGLEFAGVRPYNPGDRLRRVHWRASLARQELYVNDYYSERNADVVILLDALVSVGAPQANTLDVAVRTAASLAAHYLRHKDRVGLVHYGGVCTWLPPRVGQTQWYRILDALLDTRVHFSYLIKDIALIPPRALPPGALIFVLTTLTDPRIDVALRDLLARAFQLVLVLISPAQVLPATRRPHHREATARLWRLETDLRVHAWRRLGVPVILQESEDLVSSLSRAMAGERQRAARIRGVTGHTGQT